MLNVPDSIHYGELLWLLVAKSSQTTPEQRNRMMHNWQFAGPNAAGCQTIHPTSTQVGKEPTTLAEGEFN